MGGSPSLVAQTTPADAGRLLKRRRAMWRRLQRTRRALWASVFFFHGSSTASFAVYRRRHCLRMACAAMSLLVLVLLLVVMASSASAQPLRPQRRRQVFIMRHCVRSTSSKVKYGLPNITNLTDYTNRSLPVWGASGGLAPMACIPVGLEILDGTGAWLASSGLVPPTASVRMVSDTVSRDAESAAALLRGMGRSSGIHLDAPLFDTVKPDKGSPLCPTVPDDVNEASTSRRLGQVPSAQPPGISFWMALTCFDLT